MSPRQLQSTLKTIFVSKTLIFQKSMHAAINSMFLRFGRSSLDIKIVPKRLQESIRNDSQEYKTTRDEKKDNKNSNKKQQ